MGFFVEFFEISIERNHQIWDQAQVHQLSTDVQVERKPVNGKPFLLHIKPSTPNLHHVDDVLVAQLFFVLKFFPNRFQGSILSVVLGGLFDVQVLELVGIDLREENVLAFLQQALQVLA